MQAGDFFEQLQMVERAFDCYRQGHAYKRAVELARKHEPFSAQITQLEEEFGDWLVERKQVCVCVVVWCLFTNRALFAV